MSDCQANLGEQLLPLLPRLRRFARALTRHPHDADDLVQLAVERALARHALWRPESNLMSWLMTIMRNAWVDEKRLRGRRALVLVSEDDAANVADAGSDGEIDLWSIQDALGKLPEEQRLTVALVLVAGLSYREAANVLEVPVGTVMSRLSRGRAALQKLLRESPPSPRPTSKDT